MSAAVLRLIAAADGEGDGGGADVLVLGDGAEGMGSDGEVEPGVLGELSAVEVVEIPVDIRGLCADGEADGGSSGGDVGLGKRAEDADGALGALSVASAALAAAQGDVGGHASGDGLADALDGAESGDAAEGDGADEGVGAEGERSAVAVERLQDGGGAGGGGGADEAGRA